jgi:dTDP-4-dehydrorhamnose 3,5-epimerase
MIQGAVRDKPTATADGSVAVPLPEGASCRDLKHLVTANGVTTELMRLDWDPARAVAHLIQVELRPGGVSAWHLHERQTDSVVVVRGTVRLVLYDDREGSPSYHRLSVLNLSHVRPQLVTFPPGIWHGFRNLEPAAPSAWLNGTDQPYTYQDPDQWRVPWDTPEIPYRL